MNATFVYGVREVLLLVIFVGCLLWVAAHAIVAAVKSLVDRPPKLRCQDCDFVTSDLTIKSDHHGDFKTVCRDRNACNTRAP